MTGPIFLATLLLLLIFLMLLVVFVALLLLTTTLLATLLLVALFLVITHLISLHGWDTEKRPSTQNVPDNDRQKIDPVHL